MSSVNSDDTSAKAPLSTTLDIAKKIPRIFANSNDDDIVISGMAGRFPNCHNVAEFEYNLYNKVKDTGMVLWCPIQIH